MNTTDKVAASENAAKLGIPLVSVKRAQQDWSRKGEIRKEVIFSICVNGRRWTQVSTNVDFDEASAKKWAYMVAQEIVDLYKKKRNHGTN